MPGIKTAAGFARAWLRSVTAARAWATARGEGDPNVAPLLQAAAAVETATRNLQTELAARKGKGTRA